MSLEEKIERLTTAIENHTAALLAGQALAAQIKEANQSQATDQKDPPHALKPQGYIEPCQQPQQPQQSIDTTAEPVATSEQGNEPATTEPTPAKVNASTAEPKKAKPVAKKATDHEAGQAEEKNSAVDFARALYIGQKLSPEETQRRMNAVNDALARFGVRKVGAIEDPDQQAEFIEMVKANLED